jgi:DNA-binding MarR family transcriptional regulator
MVIMPVADEAVGDVAEGLSDLETATRLRLAVSRLNRRIRLVTNDVPPLQLSTLVTLEQHGPLRSGELAQREAVSAPTMTRVLACLIDRGLIERDSDPGDGRSVLVSISDEGVVTLRRVRSERAAMLGVRLARLTPEHRAALTAALPALEALVEADR